MKDLHIYDMDGTIVCSLHRYRTKIDPTGVEKIDLPYWRNNEHRAMFDSLLPLAQQYKQDLLNPNIVVVIATARNIQAPDMWFIRNILGMPDYLICRESAEDARGGADLKISGLLMVLKLIEKVGSIRFWEDNPAYLDKVCKAIGAIPHYIASKQGH